MTDSTKWFWLLCAVTSVLLVYLLGPVLVPFLTAFLLAYISNPLVNLFCRFKLSRVLSVVLVFLLLFSLLLALIFLLIPLIEKQITLLVDTMPAVLEAIRTKILPWLSQHIQIEEVWRRIDVTSVVKQHWQQAGGMLSSALKTLTQSGLAIVGWLANLVLIPVVTFYLLRDWDDILVKLRGLLPRASEPTIVDLATQCHEVLGAFFRGQLIVMFSLGLIYSTGLWLVGLNLALLIGLVAGLVSIVPYLGFIVGIAAALIAAVFQFHDVMHLFLVIIVFMVGQAAESMALTPLLVGDRIGLHPVAVIFAILAGGQLFGFVGVLLALPAAAVIMVLLRYMRERYVASAVYTT